MPFRIFEPNSFHLKTPLTLRTMNVLEFYTISCDFVIFGLGIFCPNFHGNCHAAQIGNAFVIDIFGFKKHVLFFCIILFVFFDIASNLKQGVDDFASVVAADARHPLNACLTVAYRYAS